MQSLVQMTDWNMMIRARSLCLGSYFVLLRGGVGSPRRGLGALHRVASCREDTSPPPTAAVATFAPNHLVGSYCPHRGTAGKRSEFCTGISDDACICRQRRPRRLPQTDSQSLCPTYSHGWCEAAPVRTAAVQHAGEAAAHTSSQQQSAPWVRATMPRGHGKTTSQEPGSGAHPRSSQAGHSSGQQGGAETPI